MQLFQILIVGQLSQLAERMLRIVFNPETDLEFNANKAV